MNHFNAKNRSKFILSLLKVSISHQLYDISYEISCVFLEDLIRHKYLAVFHTLLDQLSLDSSKYEVKLAILEKLLPMLNKT